MTSIHFLPPEVDSANFLFVAAAVVATFLTGAAVVKGNQAHEDAKPTPDFEAKQTYLNGPESRWQGMNIRKVWDKQVTGKGVRVHFSDAGLFANHEDLHGNPNLKLIQLNPNTDPAHGTASLGLMIAKRNGLGMTGICHAAELYLYNNEAYDEGYSQTLKDLLKHVAPGDIVGINRQTANWNVLSTFLPTLHDQAWWDMIKVLTERGAVVVCAAGNGSSKTIADKGTTKGHGVDLSQWRYFDDHAEAGAIVIGACQSWDGKAHYYSNYNYPHRMLNAWGDSVATLSYGDLQDKRGDDRDYTQRYAGTSSATPLVTGALSLIQSYAIEQHHVYLDANQMHLLVMQTGYQDATFPHTDVLPMGARPNVHGALVLLDRILGGGRFHPTRDEL